MWNEAENVWNRYELDLEYRIMDHRTVYGGRELKDNLVPTLLPRAGTLTLDWIAQSSTQSSLEQIPQLLWAEFVPNI